MDPAGNTPSQLGGTAKDDAHQHLCPAFPSFVQNTVFCFNFIPLVSQQEILLAQGHTHRGLKNCSVYCWVPSTHYTHKHNRNHREFFDPKFSG